MRSPEDLATDVLGFAPSAVWITLGFLVAVGVIAKLVTDLMINGRALRGRKVQDEKTIQDKLKSDHERLNKLEETTARQDEELKLILRSQMAMIHHMEDGNGVSKLKETRQDIEEYLITGKIRERKGE